MKCKNCGRETEEGNFCEHCGHYIHSISSEEHKNYNNKIIRNNGKNNIKIPIILSLLIIIILFLGLALGHMLMEKYNISISIINPFKISSEESNTNNISNENDTNNTREVNNIDNNSQVESTYPNNIINHYSNSELEKLNIFLSNFSEVNFGDFSNSNYSSKQLIDFAILHHLVNNYDNAVKEKDGYKYIQSDLIQGSINKYFHFKVNDESTDNYDYSNGKYILPWVNETVYPNFTQVKEIYTEGENIKIVGYVYKPNTFNDSVDNSWRYKPMDRVSDFNKDITFERIIEATVRLKGNNGKMKYQLINYTVNN